jgi:hypothetical protein
MKEHLKESIGIDAITLLDQPMKNIFKQLNTEEPHYLFQKYNE